MTDCEWQKEECFLQDPNGDLAGESRTRGSKEVWGFGMEGCHQCIFSLLVPDSKITWCLHIFSTGLKINDKKKKNTHRQTIVAGGMYNLSFVYH